MRAGFKRTAAALAAAVLAGTAGALWTLTPSAATPIDLSVVADYQSVDDTSVIVSQSTATLTVSCPAGLHVLGGGAEASANSLGQYQFAMTASTPTVDRTGWTAHFRTLSGGQENTTITVTALCGNTD